MFFYHYIDSVSYEQTEYFRWNRNERKLVVNNTNTCYAIRCLMFIFAILFFSLSAGICLISYQINCVYIKTENLHFAFFCIWCALSFVDGLLSLLLFHSFDFVPMIFAFICWLRLVVFIFLFVLYVLHADDK